MSDEPKIYGFILAGGSGTRLWPLSRKELPKQFIAIEGELTLLQNTLSRFLGVLRQEDIRIITGSEYLALADHQAKEVGFEQKIIAEPAARNTAAAIALGLAAILDEGASREDIVIVCPSDQIIQDTEKLSSSIGVAVKMASSGYLATFGIKPTAPETGFGYIKTGEKMDSGALRVAEFVEKPDEHTASGYIAAGNYYWNSGIFCFRIKEMLDALIKYFPECGAPLNEGLEALLHAFSGIPSISIDYAVMEKADNIICVPLDTAWSDLGSWDAVWQNVIKDGDNNALIGDVISHNVKDSLVVSREKLIAVSDVEDLVIVDTIDALYVTKKGQTQNVREIVRDLHDKKRKEPDQAPYNVRPWGTYKIISEDKNDKVKRIVVSPMKRLSLQYHKHRSEHWVVVKGAAKVELYKEESPDSKKEFTLIEGESCFVPKGTIHRLENPGEIPLEIIEVQTGSYVGEDDIIRVKDDFERV